MLNRTEYKHKATQIGRTDLMEIEQLDEEGDTEAEAVEDSTPCERMETAGGACGEAAGLNLSIPFFKMTRTANVVSTPWPTVIAA